MIVFMVHAFRVTSIMFVCKFETTDTVMHIRFAVVRAALTRR